MRRALCAAILTFEAIVLGLTTPVLISVQNVDTGRALWTGLGLAVLCLVTAGLLRHEWAYGLGWLVQLAAVVLGFQIGAMFALGLIFFVLWISAFILGNQIDAQRRHADALAGPDREAAQEQQARVQPPERWDHELACDPDTWRRFARDAFRGIWTPTYLAWCGACLVVGLVLAVAVPGVRVLGWLLVAAVVLFPGVTWLTQRQAWRTFLGDGKVYRTAFAGDQLVLDSDGHLFEVPYSDMTQITTAHGLVSTELGERGVKVDLPAAVFPADQVERVRRLIAGRPPGEATGSRP